MHYRRDIHRANAAKPGLVKVAESGALFLDEIAEMPTVTQAKILRALEQRELKRIGGSAWVEKSASAEQRATSHKGGNSNQLSTVSIQIAVS